MNLWQLIASNLIETIATIVAAVGAYIAARWLLGISSPEKDIAELLRWRIFNLDLKWYRGLEYIYQIKARRLLRND